MKLHCVIARRAAPWRSSLLDCFAFARNDAKAIPMKQPAVYMMANKRNGTIYTGVTSNLVQRVSQHKQGMTKGFTWNYGCKLLVYYEVYEDIVAAIAREKQVKAGSRKNKLALIEGMNPHWEDLCEDIV